jgi:type I site-specific restriction-modification system R (restriction) subunit
MPHAYTEDQLVEQPAIGLFAELGWTTVSASDEIFGANGSFGRETPSEVVLESRLRAALERLKPALPPEGITAAVDELTRDRSAMSLEAANREVYLLLKEGYQGVRAGHRNRFETSPTKYVSIPTTLTRGSAALSRSRDRGSWPSPRSRRRVSSFQRRRAEDGAAARD